MIKPAYQKNIYGGSLIVFRSKWQGEKINAVDSSTFNQSKAETNKRHTVPEPVNVSFWLREHDVDGGGGRRQRLRLVWRAHDEGRREVGLAVRRGGGVRPVFALTAFSVTETVFFLRKIAVYFGPSY